MDDLTRSQTKHEDSKENESTANDTTNLKSNANATTLHSSEPHQSLNNSNSQSDNNSAENITSENEVAGSPPTAEDPNTIQLPSTAGPQDVDTIVDSSPTGGAQGSNKGKISEESDSSSAGESQDNNEKELSEEFESAAENGDVEAIKSFLDQGTDINAKNNDGETALILAACYGRKEATELLLARGADATVSDNYGYTPLYGAAQNGWKDITEEILNHKNRIAVKTIDIGPGIPWGSPLAVAGINGHTEIVQLLLDRGANPNNQDSYGWTPLHRAIQYGTYEVVKVLLNSKEQLDIGLENSDGRTPLHIAAVEGNDDAVELLLKHSSVDGIIDRADSDGRTALYYLTNDDRHINSVQTLLDHGANVQHPDILEGWTALIHASTRGSIETVKLLLNSGADINYGDKDNWTALHHASSDGGPKIVEILLENEPRADIEKRTEGRGETALHIAARSGHVETVRILLKHNANVKAKTDEDETALQLAARETNEDHQPVVKELSKKLVGLDRKAALVQIATLEELSTVERLLENIEWNGLKRPDVEEEIKLIWYASRIVQNSAYDKDICEVLQQKAKEKNLPSEGSEFDSWTALYWAAYLGNYVIVWWLLVSAPTKETDEISRGALKVAENQLNAENKKNASVGKENRVASDKDGQAGRDKHNIRNSEKNNSSAITSDNLEDQKLAKAGGAPDAAVKKRGTSQQNKDKGYDYSVTIDILRNPPLVQGWGEPDDPYESQALPNDLKDPTLDLMASIMDFYSPKSAHSQVVANPSGQKLGESRKDPVDFLHRTRTVRKVIYEGEGIMATKMGETKDGTVPIGGPQKIMEESRKKLEEIASSFTTTNQKSYSKEDLKFRWIHLPANNMEWVSALVKRVYRDKKKKEEHYRPLGEFIYHSWHELHGANPELNYMRPTCVKDLVFLPSESSRPNAKTSNQTPDVNSREKKEEQDKLRTSELEGVSAPRSEQRVGVSYERVALYMPYLTFGTYKSAPSKNNNEDKENQTDGHISEEAEEKRDGNNEAKKEIKKNGKILHTSRTLDQFYYHSLRDTRDRDSSQVVTRYFETQNCRDRKSEGTTELKVLRVDQLWLWVIDEETIITSSTSRLDKKEDPVVEGIFNYLREAKGKRKGERPPSSVEEMSRFITSFCINFIEQSTVNCANSEVSARQIFANSINTAANTEADLFRHFEAKIDGKLAKLEQSSQSAEPTLSDPKEEYESINRATKLLVEVKDIRDELNILSYLLTQQKTIWEQLLRVSINDNSTLKQSDSDSSPYARKEKETCKGPNSAIKEINEMDKIAQRIQEYVNSILSLEQNEASLSEAESARKQTGETIEQGRTLMVFTVITILFLPLSFLTSLFALNITIFPHQNGNLLYRPNFIFSIIFGVTLAIIIPTAWWAFGDQVRAFFNKKGRADKASKLDQPRPPVVNNTREKLAKEKVEGDQNQTSDGRRSNTLSVPKRSNSKSSPLAPKTEGVRSEEKFGQGRKNIRSILRQRLFGNGRDRDASDEA